MLLFTTVSTVCTRLLQGFPSSLSNCPCLDEILRTVLMSHTYSATTENW